MHSKDAFPVGMAIDFELLADLSEKLLTGKGMVRHLEKCDEPEVDIFRIGVEFSSVDEDDVVYFLNRIYSSKPRDSKEKNLSEPIDFIPY